MSGDKQILKDLRKTFVREVIKRDKICRTCGYDKTNVLQVHHITDRKKMPNHGYAPTNGIALCPDCHLAAEAALKNPNKRFSADVLYRRIDANYEIAWKDCLELNEPIIWPKTN